MNERLKIARKSLRLTQREFGRRLGVKDAAISKIENGENSVTDQMVLAVCREFGINEEWLRTGFGSMSVESDDSTLDYLVDKFNLDSVEVKIVEIFLNLPVHMREAVTSYFSMIAKAIADGDAKSFSDYIMTHPNQPTAQTLPRSKAVPYPEDGAPAELTEDEAIALVKARFAAAKKDDDVI